MKALNLGPFGRLIIERPQRSATPTVADAVETSSSDGADRSENPPDGEGAQDAASTAAATAGDETVSATGDEVASATGDVVASATGDEAGSTTGGETSSSDATPTDSVASASPRRGARALVLATVCLIIIVAGVAIGTVLTISNTHRSDEVDQRPALSAQVSAQVTRMLSYDYSTVAKELPKVQDGLTDKFRQDFAQLITATVIPAATEKRIVTRASITGTSIVSQSDSGAELLLFVNQVTTSTDQPEPTTTGSRVVVTATRQNDRWLVDALKPV